MNATINTNKQQPQQQATKAHIILNQKSTQIHKQYWLLANSFNINIQDFIFIVYTV